MSTNFEEKLDHLNRELNEFTDCLEDVHNNAIERLDRHRSELNNLEDSVTNVNKNAIVADNTIYRKIYDLNDRIYERLNRHRSHLNTLLDFYGAADERATVTKTTTDRRIQALEEICKKIEARPFNAYNEGQMASGLNRLTDNDKNTREDVFKLENLVTTLNARIEILEKVPPKTCKSCSKTFRSVKMSHKKCKECYLFDKMKTCSICQCKFVPYHTSYKVCSNCYKDKNGSKSPEIFHSCSDKQHV